MIEKIVYDYLSEALTVPVRLEVPENPPERFVLLEKTGSGVENHIYSATIAVQSWAETLFDAAALNEQVKEAMDGIARLPEVCRCQLNSDYNFTDTATKRYRYQAVFDLVHY